jgi:ABC-type nitrate/sulfonate/bicarbonate transport system ATPase subunit
MQARVALCRAFVSNPAVVLLDEPFASLDTGWKQQLYKYLLAVAPKSGSTTILVTHDLLEALSLADDVFIICERARTLECCLADNPLRQTSETLSITALIADPRFSQLFGTLHESLATS